MKKSIWIMSAAIGLIGVANAGVIFSATTNNTTLLRNTAGGSGTPTLTGATTDLLYTNPRGANSNGGFASTDTINTLLGRSLTAADTVTMSVAIDSVTANTLSAGGLIFGMGAETTFQAAGGFAIALRVSGGSPQAQIPGFSFTDVNQDLGFETDLASIADGCGVTLVANNAGYTFSFTGLTADEGNGIADVTGSFSGTQFVDNFGTGHFYVTTQKDAAPDMVVDYNTATIDVIPEPATLGLIAAAGFGLLFTRRVLSI